MSVSERAERTIEGWANEFDRECTPQTIERWTKVFNEHREFFVTYKFEGKPKAALRWRYTHKNWDPKTDQEYSGSQRQNIPQEQLVRLTSKPLSGEQIDTLLNTAIALRARAMEELIASRWWVTLFQAGLGFLGALMGGFLSDVIKKLVIK